MEKRQDASQEVRFNVKGAGPVSRDGRLGPQQSEPLARCTERLKLTEKGIELVSPEDVSEGLT
jgi:hypothetical protein